MCPLFSKEYATSTIHDEHYLMTKQVLFWLKTSVFDSPVNRLHNHNPVGISISPNVKKENQLLSQN